MCVYYVYFLVMGCFVVVFVVMKFCGGGGGGGGVLNAFDACLIMLLV